MNLLVRKKNGKYLASVEGFKFQLTGIANIDNEHI
jgi:hypothetical protein